MEVTVVSDKDLIHNYVSGDERALQCLINRHKSKIHSAIYMLVRDKYLAEDIFQETFIKIMDTLRAGKYNDEGKFAPWAIRIARNICVDHFRKAKRIPTVVTSDGTDIFNFLEFAEDSVEEKIMVDQSKSQVRNLLEQLPLEQREVLILRCYCDQSFKEIADHTGVSINTALGRMRYAVQNMRKLLEKHKVSLYC